MEKEWFSNWFDSKFYHLLYADRDQSEAEAFIRTLVQALMVKPGAVALDLACGKGRHAIVLEALGLDVTGLDISANSIAIARKSETDRLSFYQHDMRLPFRTNYFDIIFNLFTSFGYFERQADHIIALKNMHLNLKPGGRLVMDFFNAHHVRANLVPKEVKTVDGVDFHLSRFIKDGFVQKKIAFEVEGKAYHFTEKVRLFDENDFKKMFLETGFELVGLYGDYDLAPFDRQHSKRLILICSKKVPA